MNRSKNQILKVIFNLQNWRVPLEVEVFVEYLCQNMGGREGVEINQVQVMETLSEDTTVIVMAVAVLKMLVKTQSSKVLEESSGSTNARCHLKVKTCGLADCMLVEL